MVQVNYEMYGPLTDDEADRLLDGCRKGTPPVSSWSGEPAPSFREVERELSGANDAFLAANIAAARHSVADHAVPPAYKTGETDIPVTAPGGDPGGHGGELFAEAFGARGASAAMAGQPAPTDSEVSPLMADGEHHPDATAEPDTSGATTDVTDTSLPATGRDPARGRQRHPARTRRRASVPGGHHRSRAGRARRPTPTRPTRHSTTSPPPAVPRVPRPVARRSSSATPSRPTSPTPTTSPRRESGGERPAATRDDDAARPDGAAEEES